MPYNKYCGPGMQFSMDVHKFTSFFLSVKKCIPLERAKFLHSNDTLLAR